MMKKVAASILTLIVLLSTLLTGCDNSNKGTPASDSAKTESVSQKDTTKDKKAEISIWSYGWNKDTIKLLTEDAITWKEKTGTKVNVVPLAQDGWMEKIITSAAANNNPDITLCEAQGMTIPLAAKDKLLCLDDFGVDSVKDQFWPAAWESQRYDDKQYGLRITTNNIGILYNKKMFDAKGVPYPDENTTWNDFREMAKKLNEPEKKIFGFDTPWCGWPDGSVWALNAFLIGNGATLCDDAVTKSTLNTPEAIEVLQVMHDMAQVDKTIALTSADQGVDRFASGFVAMKMEGSWAYSSYAKNELTKDFLGVAPLPKFKKSANGMGGEGFIAFKNTKYPQETYDYLLHITTDSEFVEKWYTAWETVPALKRYADFYKDDAVTGPYNTLAASQMEFATLRPVNDLWPQIAAIIDRQYTESIINGKNPADAWKDADDEVAKLLVE